MNTTDELKDLWDSADETASPPPKSEVILKKIKKDALKLRLMSGLELILTILIVVFLLVKAANTEKTFAIIAYEAAVVFVISSELMLLSWRKGLMMASGLSIKQSADYKVKFAQYKLRMASCVIWGCPISALIGYGVAGLTPYVRLASLSKIGVLLVVIVATVIYGHELKRKAEIQLDEAKNFAKSYEESGA